MDRQPLLNEAEFYQWSNDIISTLNPQQLPLGGFNLPEEYPCLVLWCERTPDFFQHTFVYLRDILQ